LKPENLLVDAHGHLKITDFGFAKEIGDDGRTYTLCGTPDYLAPEIIKNKGHGFAVDWWALGVIVFEMLAGYPPFYGEDPMETYRKILEQPAEFPAHFTKHARDIIRKMLQKDVSKRIGNLKNGVRDITSHAWFASVDWRATLKKKTTPPMRPRVRSADDTSNFDDYGDAPITTRDAFELTPEEQELFMDI
jgi:serine/threonine protein kinase